MVKSEARDKFPDLVEQLKDHHHKIPDSETYEHFKERITEVISALADSRYKAIVVITHGGPISFVFREILKKGNISVEDCGFAELEKVDGALSLIGMEGITLKN